jgi:selenium metabolism protein YedF
MTFLYLNSNTMGQGDDQLGKKLLITFLEKLADSDIQVDVIGCVNSGIELTTTGSTVLDSLEKLAQRGAQIATCGTCLDFHQKREQLLIGDIGSMEQTVQIMAMADQVIRPC